MSNNVFVVGVSGRSGSGKSTFVRRVMEHFGSEKVSLHTMDNYYLPSNQQTKDDKEVINFDLPSSFDRAKFCGDLQLLKDGNDVELREYIFTTENSSDHIIVIPSAPIILVEGLFIYYYEELQALLDYRVMMNVSYDECYSRRLNRDLKERNYTEEETNYRYNAHVEPAYNQYIAPYVNACDILIDNEHSFADGHTKLISDLEDKLSL